MQEVVLMIAPGLRINGNPLPSNLVCEQANSLRGLGIKVILDVVDDRKTLFGILANIRRLRKLVKTISPTIVHAQYGTVTAWIAAQVAGNVPLLISFGGTDLLGMHSLNRHWQLRGKIGRWIGFIGARKAKSIVVKSNNLFDSLPIHLQHRTRIIPNGVDLKLFYPCSLKKCREELGWALNEPIVLFNASTQESKYLKNFNLAKKVMVNLQKKIPTVRLEIIQNVSRKNVLLRLNAADCLLVTSLHEGSPNIVKEAMACNLPVVSVPCGDVVERLKNISPGGIYPYDVEVLTLRLFEVLDTRRRSNGRSAIIKQKLDSTNVAKMLADLYYNVQLKKDTNSLSRGPKSRE